jgi:ubiquinone/menaquinone biosynthesis C-methylase UbiE
MTWLWLLLAAAGMLVLAALLYWQLIVAEGAYLGPRVVAWMYDLVARRYDAIKQFAPGNESWFVARPLLRELSMVRHPLILDVATGTGRLPLALLRERFDGQILGLDLSQGMLRQAHSKIQRYGDRVHLIWQDASNLPFCDGAFDGVTCLESLEFLSSPLDALSEMVRVLAPGGVLFLTNRVGREAQFLPGRAFPRPLFEQALGSHPLRDVVVRPWQVSYDLALAHKEGTLAPEGRGGSDPASLIRCPGCRGSLLSSSANLSCPACERSYPIREGFVHLA